MYLKFCDRYTSAVSLLVTPTIAATGNEIAIAIADSDHATLC